MRLLTTGNIKTETKELMATHACSLDIPDLTVRAHASAWAQSTLSLLSAVTSIGLGGCYKVCRYQ